MNVEAFDHILLEDTFVFSWSQTPTSLSFVVLASLLQTHPDASPPADGEWACYRDGLIQFHDVSSIQGLLPQAAVLTTVDPDGSIDYGCIDALSLVPPDTYRISGEFGHVSVVARGVSLILSPRT